MTDSNISSGERPFGWKPSGQILPRVWIMEVTFPCSCDLIVWFKAWKCGLFGKLRVCIFAMTLPHCILLVLDLVLMHRILYAYCVSEFCSGIGFVHPDEPDFNLSFLCVISPASAS